MPAPGGAPPPPSRYQAYLLRLWRDGPGAPWRASLEPPGGAATLRFGTVGDLFAFLRDQLADPGPESRPDSDPPRRPARPPRRPESPRRGARRHPGAPGTPGAPGSPAPRRTERTDHRQNPRVNRRPARRSAP